jgi:hypothetical protein
MKRVFRFAYYWKDREDREPGLHQIRDGDAFIELMAGLKDQVVYERSVLNFPGEEDKGIKIDLSSFNGSDLIVITTRPPLHDEKEAKRIPRSYSTLEDVIFTYLESNFFRNCTRAQITLTGKLRKKFPKDETWKTNLEFREKKWPNYHPGTYLTSSSKDIPKESVNRTALYFLYVDRIADWPTPESPGLLLLFGLGGLDTLVWAYSLRTRFPELLNLQSPRFLMAEMEKQDLPTPPMNLSFSDEWLIETIVDIPLKT